MFTKIYDKLKRFIKENISAIIILIIVYGVFNIELPYYIDAPGSIINVSERIKIDDKNTEDIYMASVSEIKGIIPTLLWALVDKNMDIVKKEEKVYNNETYEQANMRLRLLLSDSINNATLVAFSKAGKSYEVINSKLYVTYIDKQADTNLQIGDEIISINNISVKNIEEVRNIIYKLEEGANVNIKAKRNNKEMSATSKVFVNNNTKYIGISSLTDYDVKTDPEIKFSFKSSESGPSGGLMLTLAIYNSLIDEDITMGRKIVGTGTINLDGTVGEIGGVKYKLMAAVKEKADIFIVPIENYEEANKIKEENNLKIKLISVNTFDEALEKLRDIND